MTTGIYIIKNTVNGKKYVGQSLDIEARKIEHMRHLHAGRHKNRHLQTSWNKHGEGAFEFSILEECSENLLNEREEHWIRFLGTTSRSIGYNKRFGGNSSRLTDEAKMKLSASRTGIVFSSEHCMKLSESARNRKVTKNTSPSRKRELPKGNGKWISEDTAKEIIKALSTIDKSMKAIAEDFGGSFYVVAHIKGCRSWKHLDRPWLTKSSSV